MAGGNKFALLVGFNYPNYPEFKLRGCWNDVHNMRQTLISRCGFDPNHIFIIIDGVATAENIKDGLKSMADRAEVGDILFFYFSGQGVKTSNEAGILDWDLKIITSSELTTIVSQLSANGVAVTIMSDSSYSEGLLKNFEHGILLSGCKLEESRHEIPVAGNYRGAFTYAVQRFLEDGPRPRTNEAVIKNAGKNLELLWVNQHPCLHCSPGKDVAYFLDDAE